jgi:two-component system chemotaxis response regulator CheY
MKVMIVDDSMTSRMLFKAYLAKDGQHELIEAASLPDALDKAMAVQPDLVVLDYSMPEHSGVEMAQAMQRSGVVAKFVLLTANVQKAIIDEAHQAGFVQVLEKPVNAEKIALMLAQFA